MKCFVHRQKDISAKRKYIMKMNKNLTSIVKNNCYMISIAMKCTPQLVCYGICFSVIKRFSWFLEHILGFKYIMEAIENNQGVYTVLLWIGVVWIITLFQHILNGVYEKAIFPQYSTILSEHIRLEFYQKAFNLDLECYENSVFYDEFIWCVEDAPQRMLKVLASLNDLIGGILTVVLSSVFFIKYDKIGILFIMISFLGNYIIKIILNQKKFSYFREVKFKERRRDYIKRVFYLSDYAKELRYSKITRVLMREFKKSNEEIREIIEKKTSIIVFLDFIRRYIFNGLLFDSIYLFYLTFQIIVTRYMPFSNFLPLYRAASNTKETLLTLANVFTQIHENSLGIEKIREFLETEPCIRCQAESINVPVNINSIEFKNVSFAYGENKQILNNVSFKICEGEHFAIVGHNGAGKSTLIKLLLRLYDVTSGEILLNGINIKNFNPVEYRKRFAPLLQNFQIYATSLGENVKMDNFLADDSELISEALREAGFHEILNKLERGIDTPLTREFCKDGMDFSGGEKQKIAIARMLYRNGDILVLDEPTSALDPIKEHEFYNTINNAALGKMLFMISHRLASTKEADVILVLKNGEIIERGNHKELITKQGEYAHMFRLQSEHYNQILKEEI